MGIKQLNLYERIMNKEQTAVIIDYLAKLKFSFQFCKYISFDWNRLVEQTNAKIVALEEFKTAAIISSEIDYAILRFERSNPLTGIIDQNCKQQDLLVYFEEKTISGEQIIRNGFYNANVTSKELFYKPRDHLYYPSVVQITNNTTKRIELLDQYTITILPVSLKIKEQLNDTYFTRKITPIGRKIIEQDADWASQHEQAIIAKLQQL